MKVYFLHAKAANGIYERENVCVDVRETENKAKLVPNIFGVGEKNLR